MKIFKSSVNKAPTVVITCCVLHNYCETWKISKPSRVNDVPKRDNFARFNIDRLSTLKDGKQAKQVGELMKRALFEQWLINHPKGS